MKPHRSIAAVFLGVILSLVLLALAAPLARAQAGVPLPACVDRAPLPKPAPYTPVCMPINLGGSSTIFIEANSVGAAAAWWCALPGKPVTLNLFAVRWSAVTPEMLRDAAALGMPGDNGERIRTMMERHATGSSLDMCDVWGPMRERINAAMPAPVPAAPAWTVALPTAFSTNGTALTGLAGTAIVGAACDCTRPLKVGTATYCTFKGAPRATVVAQCRQ